MIKNIKINAENIIIFLFSILPIIDSINGYLVHESIMSIGTLYKSFVALVLIIILLQNGKVSAKNLKLFLISLIYICIVVLFNLVFGKLQIITIDFPVKLIFNILIFLLLYSLINSRIIKSDSLYIILNNNSILIILTILIPYFFGLGYSIYSGDIGYKAFYYSQNELIAALIILFSFCLYKVYINFSILNFIQVVGMVICILLTNTKSSIFACLISFLILLISIIKNKNFKNRLWLILFFLIAALIGMGFIADQFASFLVRQNSLMNQYGGSLIATLTSGRIFFLKNAWEELSNSSFAPLKFLFGNGFCSESLIEMDLFDIFFYLGAVGAIAILIFFITIIKKCKTNFKKDKSNIRKYLFIMIICYSFIVGHVLFMSTSGYYFVLLCCFNLSYYYGASKRRKNVSQIQYNYARI